MDQNYCLICHPVLKSTAGSIWTDLYSTYVLLPKIERDKSSLTSVVGWWNIAKRFSSRLRNWQLFQHTGISDGHGQAIISLCRPSTSFFSTSCQRPHQTRAPAVSDRDKL